MGVIVIIVATLYAAKPRKRKVIAIQDLRAGHAGPLDRSIELMHKKFIRSWNADSPMARMRRNSSWLLSAKGFGAVASLVYLAVLTRSLGPADFGLFTLIVAGTQMAAMVVRPNCWQSVTQFGAKAMARSDGKAFSQIVWLCLSIESSGAVVGSILSVVAVPLLAREFGWAMDMIRGVTVYAILIFLSVRTSAIGALRATGTFREAAYADMLTPAIRLFGAGSVLYAGPSIVMYLMVWAASEMGAAALLWAICVRRGILKSPHLLPIPVGFWSFLLSVNVSQFMTGFRERAVILVIGGFVSEAAAGLYRLADQLANSVNRLTEILARPLFAELAILHSEGKLAESRQVFFRSLRFSLMLGGIILMVLVFFGDAIVSFVAGDDFMGAVPLLIILGIATITVFIGYGFEPLLQAAGKAATASSIRVGTLVVLAMLLWVWLEPYGTSGAAWAILISSLGSTAALMIAGFRLLRST